MGKKEESLQEELRWFQQRYNKLPTEELPPALDSRLLLQKAQTLRQEQKAPGRKQGLRWAALACSFGLVALVAAGNGLLPLGTKGARSLDNQAAPALEKAAAPQAYSLSEEAGVLDLSAYRLEAWEGDWEALRDAYPQLSEPLVLDPQAQQLSLLQGPEGQIALRGEGLSLSFESESVLLVADSAGHSLRLDAFRLEPLA